MSESEGQGIVPGTGSTFGEGRFVEGTYDVYDHEYGGYLHDRVICHLSLRLEDGRV